MDKKFCDKCKKEIKGKHYYIETSKRQEGKDEEWQEELEYCPACYKKVKF